MRERDETIVESTPEKRKTQPSELVTKWVCLKCSAEFELRKMPTTPRCPKCITVNVERTDLS